MPRGNPYPLYHGPMARYVGPCESCGVPVDRTIRPGRMRTCVECSIARQGAYNLAMATGEHPDTESCRQAGRKAGHAILTRNGHIYEKWKNGILRAIEAGWD